MSTIKERIAALRQLMQQEGMAAYIIPGTDPHASEYMAPHWQETTWISGFKGETGTVLVTLKNAFLWTDSRYYLQANKELAGTGVELMKESEIDTPTIPQWLCNNLREGDIVGVNPEMFTYKGYEELRDELMQASLSVKSKDLIAPLWVEDRPSIPQSAIYVYDEKYAGEAVESKLERVRRELSLKRADAMITSALDEIAWLLNVRGSDVDFNPVVISYVLIEKNRCTLFVDENKVNEAVGLYLKSKNIDIRPYEQVFMALTELDKRSAVLFDGSKLNHALYEALPSECVKIDSQSPISILKSQKNEIEISGEREAMKKDAVALTRFFKWLENDAFKDNQSLTEYDLMRKLHSYRAEQTNFVEESFETIAGYEGNGAIVHYQATKDDCAQVLPEGMLLLDSGGQYLDGTTDITRTVWLGKVPTVGDKRYTEFCKAQHDYTLVLKGHIALAKARFPRGTRGNQLDVLAHQYMWQEGITYGHGTGHGVGHFLGCHEGPQNIRTDNNPAPLRLGNICSDEPGIYRTNEYGIRIENLIAVVPFQKTEFGEYYQFETLTLCYYDTNLIDMSLLTNQEREWINSYHRRVENEICPLLDVQEADWLRNKCKAI